MPDIARTGGISEKKIAAIAVTYYVPVAPHNLVSFVASMASVHFCTFTPNFSILEFQMGDVPWKDRMLDHPLIIKNGYIEMPNRPGLGIELNKKELNKHLVTS
jgi:galactonate dehydratase